MDVCVRRPCGEVGRAVSFDNADRLPVVVQFPAGPQVRLKVGDQPKGRWRGPKKSTWMFVSSFLPFVVFIVSTFEAAGCVDLARRF